MEKVPERANTVQVSLKQTAAAATMSERGPSAAKNCFPEIPSIFQGNVGGGRLTNRNVAEKSSCREEDEDIRR